MASGEAIKSAENSGKHFDRWGSIDLPWTPPGELAALPGPIAGGEGVAAPLQEPHPLSRPSVLPLMKDPGHAPDSSEYPSVFSLLQQW